MKEELIKYVMERAHKFYPDDFPIQNIEDWIEEFFDKNKMSEWIKCSERIPEIEYKNNTSKDVLIIDSDGPIYVAYLTYYPLIGYRLKEEYLYTERSTGCGCCSERLNPTHWMPLPKPPKEI